MNFDYTIAVEKSLVKLGNGLSILDAIENQSVGPSVILQEWAAKGQWLVSHRDSACQPASEIHHLCLAV